HQVTNILIAVDGDRAVSESYVIAMLWKTNDAGVLTKMQAVGRYADRWSCRDGRWAIDHRRVRFGAPLPASPPRPTGTPAGQRMGSHHGSRSEGRTARGGGPARPRRRVVRDPRFSPAPRTADRLTHAEESRAQSPSSSRSRPKHRAAFLQSTFSRSSSERPCS